MHSAVKPDALTILTNQAEPARQAGAFGATKLKALSNFLDGESVYHSLDATQTGTSTTSQEGGSWPLFCGITSAITDAIRPAGCATVPYSGGPYSPNCRWACVCHSVNQSPVRPDGGTRQEGEGWQKGLKQVLTPGNCHRFLGFHLRLSDCLRIFLRCSSEILMQIVRVSRSSFLSAARISFIFLLCVTHWWPGFCLAFDALLGVFLAARLIRHPRLSGPKPKRTAALGLRRRYQQKPARRRSCSGASPKSYPLR
jgi:hypothetical protein